MGRKSLPTEAEWEYAARGGLEGADFTWGDEFAPKGRMMANTWQGEFPWQNLLLDRYEGTSPVETFPPNSYGLYDMAGNVWEWTDDYFTLPSSGAAPSCCAPHNPRESQSTGRSGRGKVRPSRDQGRLAPLRTQLLPPLPARCAPG